MIYAYKGQWRHKDCPNNKSRDFLSNIGVRVSREKKILATSEYTGNGYFFCRCCETEIPIQNALLISWRQIQRNNKKHKARFIP